MLALAAAARAMSDDALARALRSRKPVGAARDFFDLAEALLTAESLQDGLAHLDRNELAVLAVAGELAHDGETAAFGVIADRLSSARPEAVTVEQVRAWAEAASALLLARVTDAGVQPLDEVTAHLADWPRRGLPSAAELAAPFPVIAAADAPVDTRLIDRLSAEHAFTTLGRLTELLGSLAAEPARELAKGGLSLPDSKRLAVATGAPLETVPALVRLASRAELVARDGAEWLTTDAAPGWLASATPERWQLLARPWYETMPAEVRGILADAHLPWTAVLHDYVHWLRPAATDGIAQRIDEYAAEGELLGVTIGGTPGAVGGALLRGRVDAARDLIAELLPGEVDRVYLQHDLTIVAPGPVAPQLDMRLRQVADPEGRELASSYRVTAASVGRALAEGQTATSILELLSEVSLSGVPQPLSYLVTETADRYGRVRVGAADESGSRSYVRSDDAELLGQIAVDKALSAIMLVRAGDDRLLSRIEPAIVFWALSDARYPVVAENAAGEVVHLARRRITRPAPVAPVDTTAELVARLRAADAAMGETGQAFLTRTIEAAIRERRQVTVSVRMPDGTVSDYVLEPTAVAGGRMRARDRKADIERTLPLSSIDGVAPFVP